MGLLDTSAAGHPPLGVRIFEAGLQNFDTSKEASLCEQRRKARAMRRNIQRRAARKRCVRQVLTQMGMLPNDPKAFDAVMGTDPYALRAAVLDRPLSPEEFGRVIYHLAQRRGFKSNRKSARAEKAELSKAIDVLQSAIQAEGARTLGEFLARDYQRGAVRGETDKLAPRYRGEIRIRNREFRQSDFDKRPRRAGRDMVQTEFDTIIAIQRGFGALDNVLPESIERLRHFLFYQGTFELTPERVAKAPARANLHRAPKLKNCPLEEGEKRCSKTAWIAQRFRILKEVNNLRVSTRGSVERPLSERERDVVIDLLSEQKEVTFDRLRKALGMPTDALFNLERGRREKLDGNTIDHLLATGLGKQRWRDLPEEEKDQLRRDVEHDEDEQRLRTKLEALGLAPKPIEKILDWSPQDGYMAYSSKALSKIVPHLETGENEHEAIRREFPTRGVGKVWDELPSLVAPGMPIELSELTNPIVRRGLVELRKVVNAIVREHGKPVTIVVELARELRQSARERDEYNKQLAERKRERSVAKEYLQTGDIESNGANIRRWRMWRQQAGFCLYSLKPIPQELLFTAAVEEDHIQPRSQSLDDSRGNLALCFKAENQAKGNRTVAEWLGESSDRYREVLQHAEKCVRSDGLPAGVVNRLRQVHVDASEFLERQLNDTKYMSRLAMEYLQMLYPPEARVGEKAVRATRGGLTAELRRAWGLNHVLEHFCNAKGEVVVDEAKEAGRKTRADHRHHAIDAAVIACSSRRTLQRLQNYYEHGGAHARLSGGLSFVPPWSSMRDDVASAARDIVVSHRPQLKVSGALHEATYYGAAKGPDGQPLAGQFVTRKSLEGLTSAMISQIVDPIVRKLVEARLVSLGWKPQSKDLPKDWWRKELLGPHDVPVRRVRVRVNMNDPVKLGHRFASAGNNHHIAFEPRTSPNAPILVRVERMFEFASRKRGAPAHVPRNPETHPIALRLGRKESVLIQPEGFEKPVVCVVQKLSGNREPSTGLDLYLRDARDARPASEGNTDPFKRFKSTSALEELKVKKVQVDPLGRVLLAGD
jgi:CRISPR-associated endonuclease Csn1